MICVVWTSAPAATAGSLPLRHSMLSYKVKLFGSSHTPLHICRCHNSERLGVRFSARSHQDKIAVVATIEGAQVIIAVHPSKRGATLSFSEAKRREYIGAFITHIQRREADWLPPRNRYPNSGHSQLWQDARACRLYLHCRAIQGTSLDLRQNITFAATATTDGADHIIQLRSYLMVRQ